MTVTKRKRREKMKSSIIKIKQIKAFFREKNKQTNQQQIQKSDKKKKKKQKKKKEKEEKEEEGKSKRGLDNPFTRER